MSEIYVIYVRNLEKYVLYIEMLEISTDEAQMAYVTVGVITDYDCWKEDPNEQVSMELVLKRYGESIEVVRNLIRSLVATPLTPPPAMCREALKGALVTPEANWTPEQRRMIEVLLH